MVLGWAQLVNWGVTYYLIGVLGAYIAADLGWTPELVYSGFSLALLVMGVTSSATGKMIDKRGGRFTFTLGSFLSACGCLLIASTWNLSVYVAGWCLLGFGMRLTLYDAAFATLARIGGLSARQSMAQITLLGGLASTVFWPIGSLLAEALGWRGALCVYACFALGTLPLYLAIPGRDDAPEVPRLEKSLELQTTRHPSELRAKILFGVVVALTSFLNSGMSSHMIPILAGLGLGTGGAVSAAMFRGIGQTSARLCDVLFGRKLHPLTLNIISTATLPMAFCILFIASDWGAAALFAFGYGAGNGLTTITRGTLPLVLFNPSGYGALTGRLIAPSFVLSAAAPTAFAYITSMYGTTGAITVCVLLSVGALTAALLLSHFCRNHPESQAGERC